MAEATITVTMDEAVLAEMREAACAVGLLADSNGIRKIGFSQSGLSDVAFTKAIFVQFGMDLILGKKEKDQQAAAATAKAAERAAIQALAANVTFS